MPLPRSCIRLVRPLLAALLAVAAPAFAAPPLALPAGCDPRTPVTCEYRSPHNFALAYRDFFRTDPQRSDHPVPFRVSWPVGARGALPVVFWNHGLFTSEWKEQAPNWISTGQQGSPERVHSFVRAGYVVVQIGRMPATLTSRTIALCEAGGGMGGNPDDGLVKFYGHCMHMVGHHVYGRSNIPFVVDLLRRADLMLPDLAGVQLDFDRIVIGGWSGGTEIVMNFAGAPKRFARLQLDPLPVQGRIVAFMADAPRRPDFSCPEPLSAPSGFGQEAFFDIDARPFLFNTGKGDVGPDPCGTAARTIAWLSSARGNKLLAWTPVPAMSHGAVDIKPDECQGGNQALCSVYESIGVAFLDAMVRQQAPARAWLASDAVKVVSDGLIEMHRR